MVEYTDMHHNAWFWIKLCFTSDDHWEPLSCKRNTVKFIERYDLLTKNISILHNANWWKLEDTYKTVIFYKAFGMFIAYFWMPLS